MAEEATGEAHDGRITAPVLRFPLYERAESLGVLDGQSALIIAPTAAGKSHIGREAIRRAIARGDDGTHAYLVPYRALAEEVHDDFVHLLKDTPARIRITTGDHRDPVRPEEAELIVATYESFAAVLQRSAFRPGTVVADEIHLIADDDRGPGVEGLFARLLSKGRMGALCALSAVVQNGTELAGWLGIPLLEGTTADRPVPLTLEHAVVDDPDEALQRILEPCTNGERALVFCSSRGGAERTARSLKDVIAPCIPQRDEAALRAELRRSVQQCDFPRFCRHASGQAAAA